jgi:hypothetical protein
MWSKEAHTSRIYFEDVSEARRRARSSGDFGWDCLPCQLCGPLAGASRNNTGFLIDGALIPQKIKE